MKAFVNEELKIIEFLDERFYQVADETFYPSVTMILGLCYPKGKFFEDWLKKVGYNADYISERAMEAGSRIHEAINIILSGKEIYWEKKYDQSEWEAIHKFKDFYMVFKPKIISKELSIISHKYKYGGTLDLVCEINKENWIIDYKFSGDIWDDHHLQIIAYKKAWEEGGGCKIKKAGILHLRSKARGRDKTGKIIQGKGWKLVPCEFHLATGFKIFKRVLDIYNFKHPNIKPKNFVLPTTIKLDIK